MSQEGTSNRPSPTTVTTRQGRRSNSETQFPGKLHDLMTFVKKHGLESIIAWVRNGTAIMIYNPSRLTDILPMFFGQTKYRSFRRQLNMWHFERMSTGPDQGAFIHPFFIEGRKSLCAYMSRHVDPNEYQPVPLSRDFPMPTSDDTTSAILRPTRQEVLAIGTTDVGTLVSTSGTTPTSTRSSTEKPVRVDLNKNAFSTTQGKESSSCEPNNGVGSATKAKSAPTLLPMTKDEDSSSSSSSSDSSILTTTLKSLISLQHHGDKESAFTSSPNSTHHSDNQLIPKSMLEAICPGLSIPASPETVASIFRELNEFDI